MTRPILQIVELSASVPRGEDGFWSIIRDLDTKGPWTVRLVHDRTNVKSSRQVADYVRRLRLGGFAQVVAEVSILPNGGKLPPARLYRLAKCPVIAPRLRNDGSVLPEREHDQLWRAMKMAKDWTVGDLSDFCPDIDTNNIYRYCRRLAEAGVLSRSGSAAEKDVRYRLVRNLGHLAPRILATDFVFDPNTRTVVGTSIAREVKP